MSVSIPTWHQSSPFLVHGWLYPCCQTCSPIICGQDNQIVYLELYQVCLQHNICATCLYDTLSLLLLACMLVNTHTLTCTSMYIQTYYWRLVTHIHVYIYIHKIYNACTYIPLKNMTSCARNDPVLPLLLPTKTSRPTFFRTTILSPFWKARAPESAITGLQLVWATAITGWSTEVWRSSPDLRRLSMWSGKRDRVTHSNTGEHYSLGLDMNMNIP